MSPALRLPPLPAGRHYRFHAMAKPGGSICNLDCDYCYYLHKQDLLAQGTRPRMAPELLGQYIRQYIEAQTGDEVVFSWQGGEPTLLGLDFFRSVAELQRRHAKPGQRIENDLQTNGLLLDGAWVEFLKRHGFMVGLSVDGPADLHDAHRRLRGGQPTHARVMAAARLLAGADVPFAALCVVNRDNAREPRRVYRFLVDEVGTGRLQFIPAVEPADFRALAPDRLDPASLPVQGAARARPGTPQSLVTPWSVDPDDWGRFLIGVWDEWKAAGPGRIHVNLFETALAQSAGMPSQTCTQAEFCGKGLAVEHDGAVYSCDHFVYPEHRLGRISETHLGDLAFSERQVAFGMAKRDHLTAQCRTCPHLRLCWGECPKNRIVRSRDGELGHNYLCSGWTAFYAHIGRDARHILQRAGLQPA